MTEPKEFIVTVVETRTYQLKVWASDESKAKTESHKYYRFKNLGNEINLEDVQIAATAKVNVA